MEKVYFKKWIDLQWDERMVPIPGTGHWEEGFSEEGEFIDWGVDFEECNNGVGNFTVALVKISDGRVKKIPPENLKFIS